MLEHSKQSFLMPLASILSMFVFALLISSGRADTSQCTPGHFKIEGMAICHPLLDCKEIKNDIFWNETERRFSSGSFKTIYRGLWHDLPVAVLRAKPRPDGNWVFLRDLDISKRLGHLPGVKDLLGYCMGDNDTSISIAPLYEEKNVLDFLQYKPSLATRISLAKSYVDIIHNLHTMDEYPWVLCDSHDMHKTLTQFKVVGGKTEHARMVLVDLDSLQHVNHSHAARCAFQRPFKERAKGQFYAPEQFWTPEEVWQNYIGHDEKTDNWKIPIIVAKLLGCTIDNPCQSLATCEFSCKNVDDSRVQAVMMALIAACRRADLATRCSTRLAKKMIDLAFRENVP
eukprot:TRINITY_DN9438_c0_g3_i1.p2 TRINITY_DN9438_c0_g3~~TRINITY_DN9438_c0_g3_i1.p2  ORF type:complete len:342 (+),score=31.19 TRINITY_DN9438_c0_g3_i1:1343-2368(+)